MSPSSLFFLHLALPPDFQKEPAAEGEQQQQQKKKKKKEKFKPMKVLKRLSVNQGKGGSPRKEMAEKDKS